MNQVSLGEVATFIMGQAPLGNECNFNNEGVPFVKAGEFRKLRPEIREWTTKPLKFAEQSDVLICVVGATAGKLNLGIDCAIGRSVAAIRPNPKLLNQSYLFHYLKTWTLKLRLRSQGSAQGVITKPMLDRLILPLPPLPEQKRIAEVLDKADALREKRRLALQKLDTLLQSVFLEMFGDPVKNPKGWDFENFGNLCSEIYRYPTYYGIEYVERGVPEIRGELILKNGELENNKDKLRFISKETSNRFSRTVLQVGDLVLSVRGTIGKIGFVDKSLEGANITANLIRVSPNQTRVNPRFFWQMCRNESFQRKLQEISSSTTIQTLKSPDLKAIKVLLPPYELQKRFEYFYQKWKGMQHSFELSAKNTENLFQSLQQRAFKGELFKDEFPPVEQQQEKVWQQTSLF